MIRALLLGTAFLGITAGIVVLQPGADRIRGTQTSFADDSAASRANTTFETTAGLGAADIPQAPALSKPKPVEVAAVPEVVTPAASASAAALAQAVTAAVGQATGEVQSAPKPIDNQVDVLALAVQRAQQLSAQSATTSNTVDDEGLLNLTQSVLAGLNIQTNDAEPATLDNLETLITQALRQGQSDDYLDALLNEARSGGQIQVPDALITSEGKIDTATLLTSLVQQSVTSNPLLNNGPTDTGFRPQARETLTEAQVYTVKPGDSLAAISIRFYGQTLLYTAIFEANRDKLTSPDRIRIGQKLTIPVL